MVQDNHDEPVAYLGGKAAEPAEAPVEGYLGGEAPPDSLPALPPAEQQYSANDFIPPPPEAEPEPVPVPVDDYASDAPPVEAPAEDPAYFSQYANEEPPTTSDQGTDTVPEAPPADQTSEFDEPGLPKTISQQDAENIIKRITTKKILPPEVAAAEGPRVTSSPEHTPRGGLKAGPLIVLVAILLGGAAAAFYFKDQIGPYLPPALQGLIGFVPEPEKTPEPTQQGPTEEQKREAALRKIVLESEWRAFGYQNEADYKAAQGLTSGTSGGSSGTGSGQGGAKSSGGSGTGTNNNTGSTPGPK